jgi:hypothetical protein
VRSGVVRGGSWAALLLLAGLAGCGYSTPPAGAGNAASINLKLTTVPTVRSVTVSPATAHFRTCSGGRAADNTQSTSTKLGYPNGQCWVGAPGASYPITITNTGIASYVDVNGAGAVPSDDGDQWTLCNRGPSPAAGCTGHNDNWPGNDQYLVQNFGPYGVDNGGLTDSPRCDREFDPSGRCWAVQGAAQTEGIELTGPYESSDSSTSWTVTITWTPVP